MLHRLEVHLAALRREGRISTWHDRRLEAGAEWEPELRKHLDEAEVMVLLLSPDFLNSDFCWTVEMEAALARHHAGTAHVIPVVLRHCDWKNTSLAALQALPRDGTPISAWPDQDEAFLGVVQGLRRRLSDLASQVAEAPPATLPPPAERTRNSRQPGKKPSLAWEFVRNLAMNVGANLLASLVIAGILGVLGWFTVQELRESPLTAPPTPPAGAVLRLELGVHSAPIRQIAVDQAERYLVTGSDDRSVRIWELESGELRQVLRPPLGSGDASRINAVAISPDGSRIAASGFDSESPDTHSIYLFEWGGKLGKGIGGLASPIRDLAFSPDGSRIAVAFLGGGLGVYDSRTGETLFSDLPGHLCRAVEFAADSRLALACDGILLLYTSDLSEPPTHLSRLPGGDRPNDVAFQADGRGLAVSYEDSLLLEFCSTVQCYRLQVDESVLRGPVTIALSPDGRILFGGRPQQVGTSPILSLPFAGNSRKHWLPGPKDTVLDLLALRSGHLVYASADPAWAVVSADGRKKPERTSAQSLFASLGKHRPAVIDKILETRDEAEAVRLAG